jgi:V/A-type H+-transporting ATPase subunit I
MLEPKRMSRALIVGHKSILEATIDALYTANLFQMEDFVADGSGLQIGTPIGNISEVSKKIVQIRSIASMLGVKDKSTNKQDANSVLRDLDSKLNELDSELTAKSDEKSKLEVELKYINSTKKELIPFANIDLDLGLYKGYNGLVTFVGHVKDDPGVAVSARTSSFDYFYDPRENVVALFAAKADSGVVSEALSSVGFRELRVPNESGLPATLVSNLEMKEAKIAQQMISLETDVGNLKDKYADFILASDEVLSIATEKSEAPLRVATSDSTFIIDGWVLSEDFGKLSSVVESATNGRAYVSEQEITHEAEKLVPVEYNNPKISAPFQMIMDLYSRPNYKELDPSSIIFITFPLFYGMILGDIGYAVILLALALALKKLISIESIKPLMDILIYCQISTLIFGVIYGEFLGFPLASLHSAHGVIPGLIPGFETINLFASPVGGEIVTFPVHRTHLVMTMIVATSLVGFIHLAFGFIFGFINVKKQHGVVEAIFEKGSWLVVQLGIVLAVLGFIGMLPVEVGAAVLVIGVIMLLKGEGINGAVELPALLSNSLSYTRIIAVGLSSIYIASTVNQMAFEMIWQPGTPIGVMTIFAIIVFLAGHTLNTVLSIIAPGLHSLRLQYVEFFGKFYKGGGRKYNPFGYTRKYTED